MFAVATWYAWTVVLLVAARKSELRTHAKGVASGFRAGYAHHDHIVTALSENLGLQASFEDSEMELGNPKRLRHRSVEAPMWRKVKYKGMGLRFGEPST